MEKSISSDGGNFLFGIRLRWMGLAIINFSGLCFYLVGICYLWPMEVWLLFGVFGYGGWVLFRCWLSVSLNIGF